MAADEADALKRGASRKEARRNPADARAGAEAGTACNREPKSEQDLALSQVVERGNMQQAFSQVMRNRGAPGIDGMRCEDLKDWLKANWPRVRAALLDGTYLPQAVRKVDIPKPQGGVRTLGVPTVVDRLIQQALHQAMQPLFEPTFSEGSYGFRPGRSAQQAVLKAAEYIRGGKRWVVDMDLEKFFDRVNHDVLMARVARQVQDLQVLRLIRRFLQAGMMQGGVETARQQGTPQGGPLSPLLSNILLTDLDRELERRKLSFCRCADDCNVYVSSQRAGQRIVAGARGFLAKRLKLTVNEAKECGGQTLGAQVPGLQCHGAAGQQNPCSPAKHRAPERAYPPIVPPRPGQVTAPDHRIDEPGTAGLDELLQSHPEPAAHRRA